MNSTSSRYPRCTSGQRYIISKKRRVKTSLIPEDDVKVRLQTRLHRYASVCHCLSVRLISSAWFSESFGRKRGSVACLHIDDTPRGQKEIFPRRNPRRRPRRSTAISRSRVWRLSQAVYTAKAPYFGSRFRWFDSEWRTTSPPRVPRPHPRPPACRHNTCIASSCRLQLSLTD